jgi:hypothetical protein
MQQPDPPGSLGERLKDWRGSVRLLRAKDDGFWWPRSELQVGHCIQIYLWIHLAPYHIIFISYCIHIHLYSYSDGHPWVVSYSYIFEYIQKIFFRIVFLASTNWESLDSPQTSDLVCKTMLKEWIFLELPSCPVHLKLISKAARHASIINVVLANLGVKIIRVMIEPTQSNSGEGRLRLSVESTPLKAVLGIYDNKY